MNPNKLDRRATAFVWSPKSKKVIRLIGAQIWLAEVAESRPDIQAFSLPGSELRTGTGKTIRLFMDLRFRSGAVGAMHFVGGGEKGEFAASDIQAGAKEIGLHVEILNREYFEKNDEHLSTWRALVRWIHPKVQKSSAVCQSVIDLLNEKGRLSIHDVMRQTRVDAPVLYNAIAILAHSGELEISSAEGVFNSSTKIWRRQ